MGLRRGVQQTPGPLGIKGSRKALTREKALEYIKEKSGRHFDPEVVDVLVEQVLQKRLR